MACWRNRHLGDGKDADRCRHVIAGPVRAAEAKSLKMICAKAFKPVAWFLAGAKKHKRKIINNGG